MPGLELWGGVECTVVRIGDRFGDQTRLSGHHERLSDLDVFAGLGLKAIRYPVLWERVAPERPDRCDWRWSDERLARLRDLGIRPIIGLVHHGNGPSYTSLADPGFAQGLADFAARVAERYSWVEDFTPVNEPLTTARFSGLYGLWYPHGRDSATMLRLLLNQVEAVRLSMAAIRRIVPQARLIQTDDLGKIWSTAPLAYQAEFENERRWLGWDLLVGRVDDTHRLRPYLDTFELGDELDRLAASPCPPDVIGINHYLSSERFLDHRTAAYPSHVVGGNGRETYADVEAPRVVVDGVAGPEGVLREAWERYHLPLAVTEAHNGCTREEQMRWFVEVWQAAARLREEGADVRAVTAWSLLGATDWNSLLTRDAGHYEPGVYDLRAPAPRPTAMAPLLRSLAETGRAEHPVLDSPGWWHRPDRLTYPPIRCRPFNLVPAPVVTWPTESRPIIIVGARGTLGQAFARACVLRGLPHHLLGRPSLDIADAARVAEVLTALRPWAVINAAGFVNVDRAELEPERCRRENVNGPRVLAEACHRLNLRLVTFSSDLVFDGVKDDAYVEEDFPGPLNCYGRSKLDAEVAVGAVCPDALQVRTSAFFGPWDPYNFVNRTLETLRQNEPWAAVAQAEVSPTYVPHLVDRTLDLLIDGANGLHHLANTGRVSWYDLALLVADRAGLDGGLVRAVTPDEAGWVALRPRQSVLASSRAWVMPSLEEGLERHFEALAQLPRSVDHPLGLHEEEIGHTRSVCI